MGKLLTDEQKSARAAYIEDLIKDWPPPTEKQTKLIIGLLYGSSPRKPQGPSQWDLERQRKERELAEALSKARKAAAAMTACDVCNLQPDEHEYANRYSIDSHEWVPGRAERLLAQKGKRNE